MGTKRSTTNKDDSMDVEEGEASATALTSDDYSNIEAQQESVELGLDVLAAPAKSPLDHKEDEHASITVGPGSSRRLLKDHDHHDSNDLKHTSDAITPETPRRSIMREDPFAERESKCLKWQNVNMVVNPSNPKKEDAKYILKDVWGEVPPKKIVAVAGPSGAGKTSLLNVLAGRQKTSGNVVVDANIRLNEYEIKPTKMKYRKQVAFVAQDDSLMISATPRECIRFSAKLRLDRRTTEDELDRLTDRMLQELGLVQCADTVVGGALLKGISGGERKRTSVGVELVTQPSCVFLDEPTSGLDSFSAVQVVKVLKKVANAGASVLFTIHQPSSEVFEMFDYFLLMNKGRVMYQGPIDDIEPYFAQRGHPIPPRYNPADYIMMVAQSYTEEELHQKGFFPTDERHLPRVITRRSTVVQRGKKLLRLGGGGKDEDDDDDVSPDDNHHVSENGKANPLDKSHSYEDSFVEPKHVGMCTEVRMLFVREFRNIQRNRHPLRARFGLATSLGLLVGTIFFGVGTLDDSVPKNFQSHFGGLMIVLMLTMFGSAMPSLLAFPYERPIFLREYSTNHYSVVSYFISKLTMECVITLTQITILTGITYNMLQLKQAYYTFIGIAFSLAMTSTAVAVMLGSFVEQPQMAIEMLPLLFVPQFLFAGFFVATDLIPPVIRWAQYLCSMLYAIRLGLNYEFGDCTHMTCQGLLSSNNVQSNDVWWYWLVLLILFTTFRLLALFFLRKKATKFL